MKTIQSLFLTAACLAVLSACGREDITPSDGPLSIRIQASIGSMTKMTTTGTVSAFDPGDVISLYAWTGDPASVPSTLVVGGVQNTFDGTRWTPAAQMLWADMVSDHSFLGIFPARDVSSFTADAYTLNPADPVASDLMIARTSGLKASDNPVGLAFDHVMAKLNVNLTFRNQWASAPVVSAVSVTARKTADIHYLAAEPLTATGTASPVALGAVSNASWSGLQIPQTGVNTITLVIEGKNYVFTHTGDIPLSKGRYTTVNLIVGRNTIDLGSISINPWTAGTTIDGGEAQTNE